MEEVEAMENSPAELHEYPDPNTAVYITRYPWVRDDDDYIPAALRQDLSMAGKAITQRAVSPTTREGSHGLSMDASLFTQDPGVDFDPDYVSSVDITSDEENMSDDDIEETAQRSLVKRPPIVSRPQLLSIAPRQESQGTARKIDTRTRERRVQGLGRGGRGTKRGLRKPLEPDVEFKAQLSEATLAFTKSDFELAEIFTLRALQLNPEMYQAHSLLSEIHAARGDKDKALLVAWNGAHTRPRDVRMWGKIASLILERDCGNREAILRDAIYCYTRIISVEKDNVEARYQRATLNRELGYKKKVATDYEHLLKRLPHDTTVLRHLAEIYIELRNADQALLCYDATIAHFQSQEPTIVKAFTWSDVNIVVELYGFLGRYYEGIAKLKSLSRWLLGRKAEDFWDSVHQDDREWDLDDHPRRLECSDFTVGAFDKSTYGDGLPLELRIKLGIFRLSLEQYSLPEASAHFEWLHPEYQEAGAVLSDFPDLFREVANALKDKRRFEEALRYYEPLQQITEYVDTPLLMETALCHRATGSMAEAEECYKTILNRDPTSTEARVALWNMAKESEGARRAPKTVQTVASVFKEKSRKRFGVETSREKRSLDAQRPCPSRPTTKARPLPRILKLMEPSKESGQKAEVQALYARWKSLGQQRHSNPKDDAAWYEAARLLLQTFRDNKVFYPIDKNTKFYGYSKEARALANRRKYERDSFVVKSDSVVVTPDGDEITIPDNYMGVLFTDWLEVFLESGLELAKHRKIKSAYENIASALSANVFYHAPDALLSIHVCWLTCALLVNDEETLCSIARWFMVDYQFVTDGYRLYSALNRLCDTQNSWYNSSPSQKYILRQLKAMDFSFVGEERRKSLFQERASYTTKDNKGRPLQAEDLDVALIMLYGHILYAGKSYAYAVNYFLRALTLDPSNATIKLSISLGYLHWSLKRQAENRHHILMQGFAFLTEYYDDRQKTQNSSQMQEANYNVGRAYHLVGLTHLAVPYYERCLAGQMDGEAQCLSGNDDFKQGAAIALQGHWAASGDMERAREITESWLVL